MRAVFWRFLGGEHEKLCTLANALNASAIIFAWFLTSFCQDECSITSCAWLKKVEGKKSMSVKKTEPVYIKSF